MGADLYIESIHNNLREEWSSKFDAAVYVRNSYNGNDSKVADALQKEVERCYDAIYAEGYFRDSYNSTNLLWQLGLSWWKDVGGMVDDGGYLHLHEIEEFLTLLQERDLPVFEDWNTAMDWQGMTVDDGENSPQSWYQYFVDKRKELIDFLKLALDMEEPIYCSV